MAQSAEERRRYKREWAQRKRREPGYRPPESTVERRKYLREWRRNRRTADPEFRERENKNAARSHANHPRDKHVDNFRKNEHNYRMREIEKWLNAHGKWDRLIAGSGLVIVSQLADPNPKFTVIDRDGRRRIEMLYEPMPTW